MGYQFGLQPQSFSCTPKVENPGKEPGSGFAGSSLKIRIIRENIVNGQRQKKRVSTEINCSMGTYANHEALEGRLLQVKFG
jgi:hypothetical protein